MPHLLQNFFESLNGNWIFPFFLSLDFISKYLCIINVRKLAIAKGIIIINNAIPVSSVSKFVVVTTANNIVTKNMTVLYPNLVIKRDAF